MLMKVNYEELPLMCNFSFVVCCYTQFKCLSVLFFICYFCFMCNNLLNVISVLFYYEELKQMHSLVDCVKGEQLCGCFIINIR